MPRAQGQSPCARAAVLRDPGVPRDLFERGPQLGVALQQLRDEVLRLLRHLHPSLATVCSRCQAIVGHNCSTRTQRAQGKAPTPAWSKTAAAGAAAHTWRVVGKLKSTLRMRLQVLVRLSSSKGGLP